MKKLLPILLIFLASCKGASILDKSIPYKMSKSEPTFEVIAISPSEDYCTYWLKTTKEKHIFKSHFILRDTCDKYQLGQKFKLNVQ